MGSVFLRYGVIVLILALQISINRLSGTITLGRGAVSVLMALAVAMMMVPIASSAPIEMKEIPIVNSTEVEFELANPNRSITNVGLMCLVSIFSIHIEFKRRFFFGVEKEVILCAILMCLYLLFQADDYLAFALSPPVVLGAIFFPSLLFAVAKLGIKSVFAPFLATAGQCVMAYFFLFNLYHDQHSSVRLSMGFSLAVVSQIYCVALFARLQFESSLYAGNKTI